MNPKRSLLRLSVAVLVSAVATDPVPAHARPEEMLEIELNLVRALGTGTEVAEGVDPARRRHMFWVPDREVAEAWWRLHAIDDQPFPAGAFGD